MKISLKNMWRFLVLFAIIAIVCLLSQCISNDGTKKESAPAPVFEDYAGAEKCATCHKDIYDQYVKTSHHLTSMPADEKSIRGGFEKENNFFSYSGRLKVGMEKRDSGFYQTVYYNNEKKETHRFDMVIGSGKIGQSYLSRRQHLFFQLPVSYFTAANQWANSPGFPNDRVVTDRPITARCLECHATYAQGEGGTTMQPEGFDAGKMILSVGCEKCHGPSARHVEYQAKHPEDKKARFVVNPAALARQLQLDACAVCHGGKLRKTKPSFSFTPGQNLSTFFLRNDVYKQSTVTGEVDVHGNQLGLLQTSKCFKNSSAMTCNTCHNSHQNQRRDIAMFSSRCISCHNTNASSFKTVTHNAVESIGQNCIDCHMPVQASKLISIYMEGEDKPRASLLRSHFIGIYPDEVIRFINSTKAKGEK
jgi:hypothetical protein